VGRKGGSAEGRVTLGFGRAKKESEEGSTGSGNAARMPEEATPGFSDARTSVTGRKATNPRRVGGLERDEPSSLREKP